MSDAPPPVRQLGIVLWADVPAKCPRCGSAVNQAEACRSPDPRCRYCGDPLPCTPSPGRAVQPGTRCIAEITLLAPQDGGRKAPIFSGYRPELTLQAPPVRGELAFDPPSEVVMPGDTISCSIELPWPVDVHEGQTFELLEGGKVVGRGVVQLPL